MSNQKLITRVKSHTTAQGTQGAVTLALTVECITHGFEHDDFSPLIALISLSQPASAKNVRAIVGKVVQGYKLTKSDKADYGMKLAKVKGQNQGVDETQLRKVKDLVADKKTIQSNDVASFIKDGAAPKTVSFDPAKTATNFVKKHTRAEVDAMIAALQARRNEAKS